jgi:hypothetical protein
VGAAVTGEDRGAEMPRTAAEWMYWIVQPLYLGFGSTGKGFAKYFHAPSMGRDEYDWPGESLRKMYEAAGGAPVVEPHAVAVAWTSRTVYFVGPASDLAPRARDMREWLQMGGDTKMPCRFAEMFRASDAEMASIPVRDRPIAWWAMQHHVMFTLEHAVAADLISAIQLEARTHGAFALSGWT